MDTRGGQKNFQVASRSRVAQAHRSNIFADAAGGCHLTIKAFVENGGQVTLTEACQDDHDGGTSKLGTMS